MSSTAKTLAGMISNPKGDWTIGDVASVAGHYGLVKADQTKAGHTGFFPEGRPEDGIVVHTFGNGKVPPVSLDAFISFLFKHSGAAAGDCASELRRDKPALKKLERIIQSSQQIHFK
jgi:hypothetical protein